MAQLPPDGEWLMQQQEDQVVLFNRNTERELLRWCIDDPNLTAQMQHKIHLLKELTPEQKCFAHFWAGYFHAYTCHGLDLSAIQEKGKMNG
jgi:hypothetical protein